MLGKSVASPLCTSIFAPGISNYSSPDAVTAAPNFTFSTTNTHSHGLIASPWKFTSLSRKWAVKSTAQVEIKALTEEDKARWESCREAVTFFSFSSEEADKILGKAFGQIHSPYWGEERNKIVPKLETINEIVEYLRSLSLSDEDLSKLLKKFPEVLGCDLEEEVKNNVQILENQWGIKGKSLRNLLLRNPKALGYNVDCKGDCIAQCTRCWARF